LLSDGGLHPGLKVSAFVDIGRVPCVGELHDDARIEDQEEGFDLRSTIVRIVRVFRGALPGLWEFIHSATSRSVMSSASMGTLEAIATRTSWRTIRRSMFRAP
jgi:hypothetical protein